MLRLQSSRILLIVAFFIFGSPAYASDQVCRAYDEIQKSGHMSLGVNFDIPDPVMQEQFARAMDFWANLLDMDWYSDETSGCAIKVSYGVPATFDSDDIAQADDCDSITFRGEITFNAGSAITSREAYLVSIHEIGHLLGLSHNPDSASIMHATGLEGTELLGVSDIAALAARHRLRPENEGDWAFDVRVDSVTNPYS